MNEVNFVLSLVIILLFIWNFILHNKLEYVANSLNKFKKDAGDYVQRQKEFNLKHTYRFDTLCRLLKVKKIKK